MNAWRKGPYKILELRNWKKNRFKTKLFNCSWWIDCWCQWWHGDRVFPPSVWTMPVLCFILHETLITGATVLILLPFSWCFTYLCLCRYILSSLGIWEFTQICIWGKEQEQYQIYKISRGCLHITRLKLKETLAF